MALADKRLFLLDMDGTLYLDDRLFDKVPEFLSHVRRIGGRYLFLTNNSSRGVEGYMEKLSRMGIPTAPEDYLTSVDAAIDHLRRFHAGEKCYVFGTRAFYGQLQTAGIPVTDRPEDDVDILLCGFDRELTFRKLEDACILLNRGVTWLATNPDWVCPTRDGSVPDSGSGGRRLTTPPRRRAGPAPHRPFAGAGRHDRRPALHRCGLRHQRRHRQHLRPVRRGHGGGHRPIRHPSHVDLF